MSIQTEIARILNARNTLRTKAVDLGISTGTDKLDAIAAAYEKIENRGAVSAQVQEGDTYTIPKGYHNGSGTVSGVSGGGNYNLQSKTVTPTKQQQNVTPDSGYYGLSDVTVGRIPDNFQDVSSVNAEAADVLANKIIVTADGTVTPGTMPDNGAVNKILDGETTVYTIPKGHHSGTGSVKIVTEEKVVTPTKSAQEITPTKSAQEITPTAGKVLTKVSVGKIPDEYITTTDADATAADILDGKSAYVNGVKVPGSMPNNGTVGGTIDGLTSMSLEIPAGYTTGGIFSLDGSIEEALAAI